MEFLFQQSYIDPSNFKITHGTKKIKVDENFTYVKYNDFISKLIFIKEIDFGSDKYFNLTAGRDVEKHTIFRADGFDDFVIVRRFNGHKYIFDRIDFMNVEYRL